MRYCEKCKKAIHPKEETYRGLCFECYKEYLFEKIDEMQKNPPEIGKKKGIFKFITKFFKH